MLLKRYIILQLHVSLGPTRINTSYVEEFVMWRGNPSTSGMKLLPSKHMLMSGSGKLVRYLGRVLIRIFWTLSKSRSHISCQLHIVGYVQNNCFVLKYTVKGKMYLYYQFPNTVILGTSPHFNWYYIYF